MVLFLLIWLAILVAAWLVESGAGHRWHYRNPFDRTCQFCGRHEVEFGYSLYGPGGWWESYDDGNEDIADRVCRT